MNERQFFRVFARLVEKVTREPMDEEVDFNWLGYWDSDTPGPALKLCAALAADDYLREFGYRHSLDAEAVVRSVSSQEFFHAQ